MGRNQVSRSQVVWAVVILATVVGANLYWSRFVASERTLYTADHVAYWSLTSGLADGLRQAPFRALREVSRSVAQDELNLLPSLPLAPVLAVFGDSRTAWILTVLNVYAIPGLLLGWWALRRIGGIREHTAAVEMAGWAWMAAIGLFAPLWLPVSLGYLGIGGLLIAFAVYGLWLGPPADSRREAVLRAALVGALLAVLVLFRRWFAFWSLAFCVLVACETAFELFMKRRGGRQTLVNALAAPAAMAGALVVILLALGGPRLVTMVGTDYADRFVHYKIHESWAGEVAALTHHFGIIPLLAAFAGLIVLLREGAGRRSAIVIGGQTVLAALLFRRVQDPSPQHWYLLLPGLLTLCGALFALVLARVGGTRRWFALGSVLVAAALVSSGVLGFAPSMPPPLGPSTRVAPAVRGDIDEIRRLLGFLDDRLAVQDRWIYLLSASGAVSDTGLGFANRSLGTHYRSPGRFLMASQVDRRDGFPAGLFDAGLVIVPDPIQVRGTTQRVVELPTMSFRDGLDISKAFVRLPAAFSLDNGITLTVWERIRPNTEREIDALSARLREAYPDRPFVWQPPER